MLLGAALLRDVHMYSKKSVGHEDPSVVCVMYRASSEQLPGGDYEDAYHCQNDVEFLLMPSDLPMGPWSFTKDRFDPKRRVAVYVGRFDPNWNGGAH